MEDLDINPLYKAFMTKFRREFEIACKMSYVLAIPHSDTLDNFEIDQYFANSHILVPSKLLRMHFTALQIGYFQDIEIDGNKLICYLGKRRPIDPIIVNILAEEIGYNMYNKEYKTILIDRPLLSFNNRPLIRSILAPLSPRSTSSLATARQRRIQSTKPLNHHDDCVKYLECISSELTSALEAEVKRLQSNYMILAHYLDDAASRTRQLADNYIPKFELALEESGIRICETIERSIRLSVENHVVHLLHGKLIVAIQNLYEKEDKILLDKFNEVSRANLTICQLGAQSAFSEFLISEDLLYELKRFPSLQSPIAVVSSIMKLVNLISENLNQSVRFKRLMGTTTGCDKDLNASICSDDLIASFVFALAQARPNNLYSITKYLETFGWSSIARDQAAYYTATFQIVIQYIISFKSANQ